jgi:hypothetical protein
MTIFQEQLRENIQERVRAATVRLLPRGGQGVLVPGDRILTAAHCVAWANKSGMVWRRELRQSVRTQDGQEFQTEVCAVEPVADIAVLEARTLPQVLQDCNLQLLQDYNVFRNFTARIAAVPLYPHAIPYRDNLPIWVLTPQGHWITGTAARDDGSDSPSGQIYLQTQALLENGTSGGPIVDQHGQLVGIVSESPKSAAHRNQTVYSASGPIPCLALPRWLTDCIRAAQRREDAGHQGQKLIATGAALETPGQAEEPAKGKKPSAKKSTPRKPRK